MTSEIAVSDADEAWLREALDRYSVSRDQRLRDEIAARAEWLASRGARRFSNRGEPFDDLLQEARIGLLKAINRFDPHHDVPFGAYATPTIMGELRRHFRDRAWAVHVPRGAKDLKLAIATTHADLSRELGRSPRVSELASRLNLPTDVVIEALEAGNAYNTQPLDTADPGRLSFTEDAFDAVLDREVLLSLLDHLPPRQRRILQLRFFEGLTQSEIAARIGTSQVHVGRLIAASLAELHRYTVKGTTEES